MFDRASRLAPAAGLNPVGPTLKCCADQFDSEPGLIVETPTPKAKRSGIGKLNNPAKRMVMKPKFQKQSALKLAGRIIPHKQGTIPRSLLRNVSKAYVGIHTRDF
jgi:hypothetical protein